MPGALQMFSERLASLPDNKLHGKKSPKSISEPELSKPVCLYHWFSTLAVPWNNPRSCNKTNKQTNKIQILDPTL